MAKKLSIIKKHIQTTWGGGYFKPFGYFCGFYDLEKISPKFKNPVLCLTADGVGTKTIEANLMDNWKVIGEDIVNHNLIDVGVHGAKALAFLDYVAGPYDIPERIMEPLMEGMASAARQNKCEIVGGETADFMTGVYQNDRYDVVGFMVGVVEKDKVISGKNIKEGDEIIGLASNGLHTNGYVLVRTILFDKKDPREVMNLLNTSYPELGCTLGEELTKPHYPYYSHIHGMIDLGIDIHGLAHITGGGLGGNIIRILPDNMEARICTKSWPKPPIFPLIQKAGDLGEDDMEEHFNLGIGLACIVPLVEAEKVLNFCQSNHISAYKIGRIQRAEKKDVKLIFDVQYPY